MPAVQPREKESTFNKLFSVFYTFGISGVGGEVKGVKYVGPKARFNYAFIK